MGDRMLAAGLAALSASLGACAIVESKPSSGSGGSGVAYMLPKALLPVELVETDGALSLTVQSPVVVGDPAAKYLMARSANAFSSDNVAVAVSALGLLETVKVSSKDESLPALIKIAAARATPEAADNATATVLYRGYLDPMDTTGLANLNTGIKTAVAAFVKAKASSEAATLMKGNCETGAVPAAVGAPVQAQAPNSPPTPKKEECLTVEITAPAGAIATRVVGDDKECEKGICYRVNLPYILTLKALGTVNTVVVSLPNGSPSYGLSLERWAFVKTTHDVTLQGGVLKSVTTDRPSSALALAAAPLDAASAVLTAVSEIVQLKIDLSGKEASLANTKIAEIKAKSDLEKALVDKSTTDTAEAAILGPVQRRDSIASVTLGTRKPQNALDGLTSPRGRRATPAAGAPAPAASGAGGARVQPGNQGR